MGELKHLHATYNDIHNLIKLSADDLATFKPDLFVAIGGGGFFPARALRTFLKDPSTNKNIPIQAIGLSLYEALPGTTAEQIGHEVIRTQWLGPDAGKTLLGRRVVIVDEVDDTRKTLQYALLELQKDVEKELLALPESERKANRTEFAIYVVHNKLKPKVGKLPPDVPYFVGAEVGDVWLDYPWEAEDIEEHDRLAAEDKVKLIGAT
ncbi:phosphoribosyltransferase-like protein [Boletus reticuloceps]|uniref:Phosphoribosyltransferase-like protein n=1 Tax=Boletus reticuloceps TaxID=495285 RepID=A0A8I2Z2S3_9AGAM|nr:phosphoribosyltransferase-like protein [Boletus reticuloceps]